MLKALAGLLIAGAVALAIASPAAAAPVCHDDNVIAYGGSPFAAYAVYPSDFCDGSYDIVSVDWSVGSNFVYWTGTSSVLLDGLYYSSETAVITVTDGTDTDQFTLVVTPCYYPYAC